MKREIFGGLAALSIVGVLASLAPAAIAQNWDYKTWRDSAEVRQDVRAIHGEDRRIAADRARLRADLDRGHYREARADQAVLHRDLRARNATKPKLAETATTCGGSIIGSKPT